jgi:CheY-like chemotaxis protein
MSALRVLLVEDSASDAHILNHQMTKLGLQVVATVGTAAEALSAFEAHLPNLVAMDVNLPDGSGIQTARTIIQKHPQAVILLITSDPRERRLEEALRAGIKGYIEKPVRFQQLKEVTESLTRHLR